MGSDQENLQKNPPAERKEIHRAVVIDEIWVVQEGKTPQVFVSLLHKKSKDWWETVGGEIEGDVSEETIAAAASAEREQEAPTDIAPILEQTVRLQTDPHTDLRSHLVYLLDYPRDQAEKILAGIHSYPQVTRRFYKQLPHIVLGSDTDIPERREHDDWLLLDISGAYYSPVGYDILREMKTSLRRHVIENTPVKVIRDPQNSRIVTLNAEVYSSQEPLVPLLLSEKEKALGLAPREVLRFSEASLANLHLYATSFNRLTNGLPYTKTGEQRPDFKSSLVLHATAVEPTEK